MLYGGEAGFDPGRKTTFLQRLRDDGVWLIDAVEEPIDKRSASARRRAISAATPHLVWRVRELAPTIGVIICHSVVFELTAPALRASGAMVLHSAPLPFPLGNWRAQFVDGVRAALVGTPWRRRTP